MSKKKKMEILTELPRYEGFGSNKGKMLVDWKETIGMTIEVEHEDYGKVNFRVLDFRSRMLILDYEGYVFEKGLHSSDFIKGSLGNVLGITNSSRNTFHLDDNNILHIYGENKNGKWEALYSGNHVDEVMNSSWSVNNNRIRTGCYNFKGKSKHLHHVDINPKSHMVIDHISNEFNLIDKFYDNRLENLREVSIAENNKNFKCRNEWNYNGLRRSGKGWRSLFYYNQFRISTKTNHDLNEAIIDNLIAQRYLGYKHQEEEFCKLDELSKQRIKDVVDLLDEKIKNLGNITHKKEKYNYDITEKDRYCVLNKNGYEMLFDFKSKQMIIGYVYPIKNSCGTYWYVYYKKGNAKIKTTLHRYFMSLNPNEYVEYKIHVDHLNNNSSDNRLENLAITTSYSNSCNKVGIGYRKTIYGGWQISYMINYKFWDLIGGTKRPTFKTEQEAIVEVERRKAIIENSRVKLKSKQELDELIQYCLDNNYLQKNGLADLDLGYLYWKGIFKYKK